MHTEHIRREGIHVPGFITGLWLPSFIATRNTVDRKPCLHGKAFSPSWFLFFSHITPLGGDWMANMDLKGTDFYLIYSWWGAMSDEGSLWLNVEPQWCLHPDWQLSWRDSSVGEQMSQQMSSIRIWYRGPIVCQPHIETESSNNRPTVEDPKLLEMMPKSSSFPGRISSSQHLQSVCQKWCPNQLPGYLRHWYNKKKF